MIWVSFPLRQRGISYKIVDMRWLLIYCVLPSVEVFLKFVPGFVFLLTLEDMCGVFDGMSSVPRSVRGYPCTSYLHNYSSREFFGG